MKTINRKSKLNSLITEILWDTAECAFDFPYTVLYQEENSLSKFKFTIEKICVDYFIDANGQKWIKAPQESNEMD